MVPHLITALTGPINELEQRVIDSMPATERWFRLEWMEHTPPFYTSVDIRNAGFKLAPVDTNLFPGGWNNLTPEMLPLAVQAAMAAIEKSAPEARNLLIIPENQTRNSAYPGKPGADAAHFNMAGLNVRVGSISAEVKKNTVVELPSGETITLEPVVRTRGRLGLKNFDPAPSCSTTTFRPVPRAFWKTCTSSTCCRRCMRAGPCGAKATISAAMKRCQALWQVAGHRSVAHQPDVHQMRRGGLCSRHRDGRFADPGRRVAGQGSAQVQRNTVSTRSRSWWSRPTTAPMAWA